MNPNVKNKDFFKRNNKIRGYQRERERERTDFMKEMRCRESKSGRRKGSADDPESDGDDRVTRRDWRYPNIECGSDSSFLTKTL